MEEWLEINKTLLLESDQLALFMYTPICGTCKLAERMLMIIEELIPELPIKKINLNFVPDISEEWEIQSVPCLLIFKNGKMVKRVFAFQSVDYLYKEIKYVCSTE
ncbi:thioredoxin family protein [Bacillus sp. AK128]